MNRQARQENVRANVISPGNKSQKRSEASGNNKGKKPMDKTKRDRLRAEGRCFNCEEPGHEFRNCPKLHLMRPPQIKSSSVQITQMEKLAHQKKRADTYVGKIDILSGDQENIQSIYDNDEMVE